jgi:hypothetical protein
MTACTSRRRWARRCTFGSDNMEVEYQLTSDDLYAFQWRAAYTSPRGRRARRKPYIYLFLTLLLVALLPAIGSDGFVIARVSFLFLVTTFPLVASLYWLFERRLIRRAIQELVKQEKPDKGQLGTHKIVLTDSGVVETTAVGESHTSWAGVDRVEQSSDYIFIYTSHAAAHIIPKRAFSESQAEPFFQVAQTSKEQANPRISAK